MKETLENNQSTKAFVYEKLKKKILNGEMYPGKAIVEKKLSQELKVSRTPLREALSVLEQEGLVIKLINGRMKVASISRKEVKELFTVRKKLEGIIVEEAIEHVTSNDIKELATYIEGLKSSFKQNNIESVLMYGDLFHSAIYEISQNKIAYQILKQVNDKIKRYRNIIPMQSNDNSLKEHELILNSIRRKDKLKAQELIESHIHSSLQIAMEAIEQYDKDSSMEGE